MVTTPHGLPVWLDPDAGRGRGSKALALSFKLSLLEIALWVALGCLKALAKTEPFLQTVLLYGADNFGNITLGVATTAYVVFTYQLLESAEAQRRSAAEPVITHRWATSHVPTANQVGGISDWVQSACDWLKASGIAVESESLPASPARYIQVQLSNAKEVSVTWLQLSVTARAVLLEQTLTLAGQIDLKDISVGRGEQLAITVADLGAIPTGVDVTLRIETLVYGSVDPAVSVTRLTGDRDFAAPGALNLRPQPLLPEGAP